MPQMPLLSMSPNIPSLESKTRKRSHDETLDGFISWTCESEGGPPKKSMTAVTAEHSSNCSNGFYPTTTIPAGSPPAQSSPASLTDAGSSTAARNSPSPNPTPTRIPHPHPISPISFPATHLTVPSRSPLPAAPALFDNNMPDVATQTAPQAVSAKRKRLTPEEKAAREKAEAEKKAEKEKAKAARAVVKAQEEAEKKLRAEQRAAKAAEKAQEEAEKKAEKAKAERAKQEEEEKKKSSQKTLSSFFKIGTGTSKTAEAPASKTASSNASSGGTPKKPSPGEISIYDKIFQPFFVKENVSLASNRFEMDDATREAKTCILGEFINSERSFDPTPFNPTETFHLPFGPAPRGRVYPSVRNIMSEYNGASARTAIDLTTESQNTQIRQTREALKAVPMKFLGFREDVRPPYFGTITALPPSGSSLRTLARNPLSKTILPLNYEYDSEAEWQEDDGEDVDVDEDEEDLDVDEDMADFLDDSEDAGPARPAFTNGMEPESTGLCWENHNRLGPNAHMYKFRMEFILETLDHHSGIDPFSTKYWEPKIKSKPAAGTNASNNASTPVPSRLSGTASASTSVMAPPPAPLPSDAFQALTSTGTASNAKSAAVAKKSTAILVPDLAQKLRELILANPALSKVGTIELFSSQHSGCNKAQIRNSLDAMAVKEGKMWKLKEAVAQQ